MEREQLGYLLQNADNDELMKLVECIVESSNVSILANPAQQTLMVPVLDPVTKKKFYSGEILVTQAIVDIDGNKGWGMVMDKKADLALAVAICDAAYGAGIKKDEITSLAEKAGEILSRRLKEEAEKASSTKVSFDMMSNMSGNM